jgi:DNA-binding NarL/FixJ family response regulator
MSRVLLVDANEIFRLGLREVIKTVEPALTISEADNVVTAQGILREKSDIALIVLAVGVTDSGKCTGLFQLRNEFPEIPVVMLSDDPKSDLVNCALAVGAAGIIERSAPCDATFHTLKRILFPNTESKLSVSNVGPCASPIESLSPALLRVLMGVKRGLRNKEIAFELGLSEKTIKAYLGILYRKLGVNSRTQAVILLQDGPAETGLRYGPEFMAVNIA